jgi:hypothetical protein
MRVATLAEQYIYIFSSLHSPFEAFLVLPGHPMMRALELEPACKSKVRALTNDVSEGRFIENSSQLLQHVSEMTTFEKFRSHVENAMKENVVSL